MYILCIFILYIVYVCVYIVYIQYILCNIIYILVYNTYVHIHSTKSPSKDMSQTRTWNWTYWDEWCLDFVKLLIFSFIPFWLFLSNFELTGWRWPSSWQSLWTPSGQSPSRSAHSVRWMGLRRWSLFNSPWSWCLEGLRGTQVLEEAPCILEPGLWPGHWDSKSKTLLIIPCEMGMTTPMLQIWKLRLPGGCVINPTHSGQFCHKALLLRSPCCAKSHNKDHRTYGENQVKNTKLSKHHQWHIF